MGKISTLILLENPGCKPLRRVSEAGPPVAGHERRSGNQRSAGEGPRWRILDGSAAGMAARLHASHDAIIKE